MRPTLISRMLLAATALACLLPVGCSRRTAAGPISESKAVAEIRKTLESGAAKPTEQAAAAEDAGAPAGWATVRGTFKFVGTAPVPSKAAGVTPECSKHTIFDESVVVGPANVLENGVIFLRTKPQGIHPDYEKDADKDVEMDNLNCRFNPHVLVMRTSQKLKLKNSDPFGHNSKIEPTANAPLNVILTAGLSEDEKFPKEEQTPVKIGCNIHPWMGGWLVIRTDPYAAKSDKSGSFELANLPAGKELEFQLWQEKAGMLKGVTLQGTDAKVDGKGRFKLKLEPGQDVNLVVEVPADLVK